MSDNITTICVIGAGYMGRQIIEKSALYGYNINVYDVKPEGLKEFINGVKRKTDEENLKSEIKLFNNISDAVKNADLIIETVPEKLELKREIFPQIDKYAPPNAIIATNSSSIPISKLEGVVKRKDKVLNIHFYNLFTMPMADIMRGTQTSNETFQIGKSWVESIDILPLVLKRNVMVLFLIEYGELLRRIV